VIHMSNVVGFGWRCVVSRVVMRDVGIEW